MENMDKEKLWAGLLGVIAIVAIVFEVAIAGFDNASIAAAIKDVSGIIIDVVMLIVALNIFKPKKKVAEGFEECFKKEMESVIAKYSPLIKTDEKGGRYNIADNMAVLYQEVECNYNSFLDFDFKNETIDFYVHKRLFMGRTKESFEQLQTNIITDITNKIKKEFSIVEDKHKSITNGFRLYFKEKLLTKDDARAVANIVDKIILLYIVEYKK